MPGTGGGKTPLADRGEDNPLNCRGGSICRCMGGEETGGPGITAAGVPALVGPLPDPEPRTAPSPEFNSPALPPIGPCVCWDGCCWEASGGEALVSRDVYI